MRPNLELLKPLLLGVSSAGTDAGGSAEALRRLRLLNLIPGIGALVLFPMGILAWFQGYRTIAGFNLLVCAYLGFALVYVRTTGRERGVLALGMVVITVYFFYLFATGGTFGSGHIWYSLLPLIGYFLLGARWGLASAGGGMALLLCQNWLTPLLGLGTAYSPEFLLRFAALYLVTTLFAFSFERSRERAHSVLEAGNLALNRTVGELQAAKEAAETFNRDMSRFLGRAQAQARTLARLATEPALHAGDLQAACKLITEAVADTLGVARASVWLYNPSRDAILCKDLFLREERRHASGLNLAAADFPVYFAALRTERSIAAADAHHDPRTAEFSAPYLAPLGISSMLDATIRVGEEIIGVLCSEHVGPPRSWTIDEQNFAGSVSDLIALTLQARERRQAREDLLAAKQAAVAANEAKSRFLATMSHEIRTPMNGILGMAELLAGTELSERQRGFVQIISASGNHLLKVVNEVLDFSRIEAGKLRLEIVEFDLRAELRQVIALFAEQARRKDLALACDLPPDLPAGLRGDAVHLRQVLVNLVGNAVKFTERGGVALRVTPDGEDSGRLALRFEVRDTGIGIPPGMQAGIFDAFSQADGSTTRRFGGTGLGLTICRHLVELMGGAIGVESREGEGSCFWFLVPLEKARAGAAAGTCGAEGSAAASRRPRYAGRVLLAEDNRVNQEVAIGILAMFGLEPTVAGTGSEALEQWRSGDFDLILMDCQMPEMDGYEAARRIRAEEATACLGRRTPIVALTANALAGDRELSLAAGMDDHLGKPFLVAQIAKILERWLEQEEYGPAVPTDSGEAPSPVSLH